MENRILSIIFIWSYPKWGNWLSSKLQHRLKRLYLEGGTQ